MKPLLTNYCLAERTGLEPYATNINKYIVYRRIVSPKDYSMPDTSNLENNDTKDDQFVVKTSSAIISVRQNRSTGEPLLFCTGWSIVFFI